MPEPTEPTRIPSLPCSCSQKKANSRKKYSTTTVFQTTLACFKRNKCRIPAGFPPQGRQAEQLSLLGEKKKEAGIEILLTLRISVSGSHFAGVVLALCITALAQIEIPRNSEHSGGHPGKKTDPNPPFYLKIFLILFLLSSPRSRTVNAPQKKMIFKISTAGAVPILNLPKLQSAIFQLIKKPLPKSSLHPSSEGGFAGRCSLCGNLQNSLDFLWLGGIAAEEFY